MGFEFDQDALARVESAIAGGVHVWAADIAVPSIRAHAPRKTGRYRRTIHATTFWRNRIVGGPPVRGRYAKSKAEIWVYLYTTSPVGHLLEGGTQRHDVSRKDAVLDVRARGRKRRIIHPGSRRFPHFGPGILATRGRIVSTIAHGARARL